MSELIPRASYCYFFTQEECERMNRIFTDYVRDNAISILQLTRDTKLSRATIYFFIHRPERCKEKTFAKIYKYLKDRNLF